MSSSAYRRRAWADVTTGGLASITGTVRQVATPVAGRPVVLMEQIGLTIRRTTTSAADGTYAFTGLATDVQWLVLAFDPAGAYNAVVADRVQT